MAELKTKATTASVAAFRSGISDDARRHGCRSLLTIMKQVAGENPKRRALAFLVLCWLAGGLLVGPVAAETTVPVPIVPDTLQWSGPPHIPGLKGAWVLGAERESGAYLQRVKLAPGTRIPPHTHPDERSTTVLAGTIYVGFGESFDEAVMVAVPAGAVYVAPANVPHFVWARDEEAVYQEAGFGPTATAFIVNPAAAPSP